MSLFNIKSKQKIIDKKVSKINENLEEQVLSDSLEANITIMKSLFKDDDSFITRDIDNDTFKCTVVYCDGLVDNFLVNECIVRPLSRFDASKDKRHLVEAITKQALIVNEIKTAQSLKDIIEAVTYGDVALFIDGYDEIVTLNAKGFKLRGITEPENEKILSGPREGFTESLLQNTSMIHRKLRTNELKLKYMTLGQRTRTKICICYIDGIVNKNILQELYNRLEKIDIDGILDSNYITELIRDAKASPFRTIGYTERPDVVVGKILEGRIAVLVDGTPVVLTLPYLFIENFQSSEDYYYSYYYTSFSRFLRILAFFLTIAVPAFYIAVVAFHHELLPTPLFINIAIERQSVPLPAAAEAFVMLIVFEILRETGIRMPSNIGQALSIVGALVIGQAAVQAKLVAAPMIIVVGLTGITSLLVPKMNASINIIRLMLLLLASMFGLFGLIIGLSFWLVHLLNLRSFGVSEMTPLGSLKYQDIKDTIFISPWQYMTNRPKEIATDVVRMKYEKGDSK